jgi:hypothetical protein
MRCCPSVPATNRHNDPVPEPLPPLADEAHFCADCRLDYASVTVEEAVAAVGAVGAAARRAVAAVPEQLWRLRPADGGWSVAEYTCHLRDVYLTYTIRLHRARTEDRPRLEPMLNDLRARRFGYNDWSVPAALDELSATASGFCEEARRMRQADWGRTVTRLPGEERTARWLLRQATHEGLHHVHDIERVARLVAGSA